MYLQTFVPICWIFEKQTLVSRISKESEVISLDAGLRMDGIPALDLWNLVMEVFNYSIHVPSRETRREMRSKASTPTPTPTSKRRDTRYPR